MYSGEQKRKGKKMKSLTVTKNENGRYGYSWFLNRRHQGMGFQNFKSISEVRRFTEELWAESSHIQLRNRINGKWHTIRGGKNGKACPLLEVAEGVRNA